MTRTISINIFSKLISLVANIALLYYVVEGSLLFGEVLLVYWMEIVVMSLVYSIKILAAFREGNRLGIKPRKSAVVEILFVNWIAAVVVLFVMLIPISYFVPGGLEVDSWIKVITPQAWNAAVLIAISHTTGFIFEYFQKDRFKKLVNILHSGSTKDMEFERSIAARFVPVLFGSLIGLFGMFVFYQSIKPALLVATLVIVFRILFDITESRETDKPNAMLNSST